MSPFIQLLFIPSGRCKPDSYPRKRRFPSKSFPRTTRCALLHRPLAKAKSRKREEHGTLHARGKNYPHYGEMEPRSSFESEAFRGAKAWLAGLKNSAGRWRLCSSHGNRRRRCVFAASQGQKEQLRINKRAEPCRVFAATNR